MKRAGLSKKITNLKLVERSKNVIATATLRQSAITFGGTLLNGALGAVFYILCARVLLPSSFGILSVALSVAMLASSIADFGIDTGVVRYVSYYLTRDKERANKFLKLSLKSKVTAGLLVAILGFFLSEAVARYIFQKPELAGPFRIAFIAVFATLVFGFVVGYLKSLQKFFYWSLIQVGANLIRVLIITSLFLLGALTVGGALWTYTATLLIGFVIGFIFLVPKDFLKVKKEFSVSSELFHYSKWVASFTLISALSSRLDTFISARLLSSSELGIYAAANQLVYIVPQIVGALGTVIAPKMSGMGAERVVNYLKKTQLLVLGLAFLGVLAAPVVALFVPIIYGQAYSAAIPPFLILLASMLVFLISVPVHNAIIYYYSYPKLFFYLAICNFLIILLLGWVLISRYGIIGASASVLVGTVFNFIIPVIWIWRRIKIDQSHES
jgi:O-antigen/teichoic acid export membrane protein